MLLSDRKFITYAGRIIYVPSGCPDLPLSQRAVVPTELIIQRFDRSPSPDQETTSASVTENYENVNRMFRI
jgi:hypothetical protein